MPVTLQEWSKKQNEKNTHTPKSCIFKKVAYGSLRKESLVAFRWTLGDCWMYGKLDLPYIPEYSPWTIHVLKVEILRALLRGVDDADILFFKIVY